MAVLNLYKTFDYRNVYEPADEFNQVSVIGTSRIIDTDSYVTYDLTGVGLAVGPDGYSGTLQGLSITLADELYLTLSGVSYDLTSEVYDFGYQPTDGPRLFGMAADLAVMLSGDDSITGSAFTDRISGFNGNDIIYGMAGNDWLEGGAGSDTIFGGVGNDSIFGGTGNDVLNGDAGDDFIRGGSGDDTINGGDGFDWADYRDAAAGVTINLNNTIQNNTVNSGVGNDSLISIEGMRGSNFSDVLTGNGLDNFIRGGLGDDTIDGGAGFDWADYRDATGSVTVNLALGTSSGADGADVLRNIEAIRGGNFNDRLTGNSGDNWLRGGRGNDTLDGGAGLDWADYRDALGAVSVSLLTNTSSGADGNDSLISIERIRGSKFSDTLTGNNFDNVIRGGLGNDTIDGQGGFDVASYWDATGAVAVNLSLTSNQATGADGTDQLINIEGISSGHFNDRLTGNSANNFISGNRGNDTIDGGGGIDIASYRDANGSVSVSLLTGTSSGADGSDTLLNIENLEGGKFADVLTGDANNNLLRGREGNDTLDGGAGVDTADYSEKTTAVTVTLNGANNVTVTVGGVAEDVIRNIENVNGGSASDRLTGDSLNNTLAGNAGNDTLDGGAGNDTMIGGAGNDIYYVRQTGDVVTELANEGTDLVYSYLSSYTLGANVENGRIISTGTASLTGNSANNVLFAGAGNNILDGSSGTDTVSYQYGVTGTSGVTVSLALTTAQTTGGSGSDTLISIENLTGSNNADRLTGNTAANVLSGGAGNDTIAGGAGNDRLTGGTGNDQFIFNTTLGSTNIDTITDFTSGSDKIVLDDDIFTALGITGTTTGVALTASRFHAGTTAADSLDRIIYNQSTGQLFYDADGSGTTTTAVQFATLSNKPATLALTDFLVIA
jgi:Ca2+-binding RTX toxin-like protein